MEFKDFSNPRLVEISYLRGELRLTQTTLGQPIQPAEIMDYEECPEAYEALESLHKEAQQNLFDVMGLSQVDIAKTYQDIQRFTSWFVASKTLSNGRNALVSYEVGVNVKDGLLDRNTQQYGWMAHERSSPIAVSTRTVHKPAGRLTGHETAIFTGAMQGLVLFDSDAFHTVYTRDQIRLSPLKDVDTAVTTSLEQKSRREALARWVGPLLEKSQKDDPKSPKPDPTASRPLFLGLTKESDAPLRRLLTTEHQDPDKVLGLLDEVFLPEHFRSVYAVLSQPTKGLIEAVKEYPSIQDRFYWLMHNTVAMRKEIEAVRRKRIVFDYKDTFLERLGTVERSKVDRIASLTSELKEARNINDSRPVVIKKN
jgi:hypothetical protein